MSCNSCFLISLALASCFISDDSDVTSLVDRIEESLTLKREKFRNIINFSNSIMRNTRKIIDEYNLRYNLKVQQKNDDIDILNNVSEYVTLLQLIDSLEEM